ncbi:hypothetical protein BSF41_47330 [Flavobacterium sp. ACN2]|uniref:hypothetical protein n=1 Tax=Flavobacterium sp. ACN2 TaxID=1975676 RepID=UPI000BB3DD4E|nr:hypothetical protein [Flavobacterium sp. ACN2]PBI82725.1 hypothetical protein BSF41_47330 [Flavobacterium sp. ACN2]
MSEYIRVKGNIIEKTGGTSRVYAKGGIEHNSNGKIEYFAESYSYGEPQKPPLKLMDGAVKEIELLTALDLGSANNKSGKTQQGMIFGNTYHFRVKSYMKDPPNNLSTIKWMIKYESPSQNKWLEIPLTAKGNSIKITLNDEDMCGCFIYLRAYVYNKEKEAEYKEWKHNRFKWFDSMIVESEITERTDNGKPWLIDQSGTSLCGMACIFYLFAKEQPDAYKKFAKELFRTGVATVNSYTVKPSIEILEKNPMGKDFPHNGTPMFLIDYITMAGTRNTDNRDYKGGNEEFQAINWPPLMTSLSEKLLGYKDVVSKGVYNPVKPLAYSSLDIKNKIDDINNQFKSGYKLILMIDSDLIDDIWDTSSLDLHWIVLESPIIWNYIPGLLGVKLDEIDFKVYTWGTDPNGTNRYLKKVITSSHFINNYNGYIKMK